MKTMKKLASLLLALAMIFALATTAFAQEVDSKQNGQGSITISNASKGLTYKVVKLFEAKVVDGSISYQGIIPNTLDEYFEKDAGGNILFKKDADQNAAFTAMKTWATTQTAMAEAESEGGELKFTNLPYGYYVITTTTGTAVTVDSTNPDATVYDKNTYNASITKTVGDNDVFIGQTVTYTLTATTSNYLGTGENAELVTEYVITDTLPDFLTDVTVTGITIGDEAYTVDGKVPQFGEDDKKITIPWVDATSVSKYENGAPIVVTYTAKVTDKAAIAGAGNKNEVTLSANGQSWTDEEVIYTYAIALKKVDQKGNALAGATFQFPFYVKVAADTDGAYIYAGTTNGTGLTNTITTPTNGVIIVKGLKAGETVTITETAAPSGYNILTAPIEITPVQTSSTATDYTVYLDKDGNIIDTATTTTTTVKVELDKIAATAIVVVNKAGTELPSTGGMGTTLFYVVGGILVAAAAVLLVTKKRMAN